jgi:hypothetical protein
MEKIGWTDRMRTEGVLYRVERGRNVVHTIKRRKAYWIGHILHENCLLVKHVIDGKTGRRIEVMGRLGRRRTQLLDGIKEKRGY